MTKVFALFASLLLPALPWPQTAPGQAATEPRPGQPVVIPTRYEEHRFVATPVTEGGVTLALFTDSAGGLFLHADVAERLRLPTTTLAEKGEGGQPPRVAALPRFKPTAMIPAPLGAPDGRLSLFPRRQDDKSGLSRYDGMLGQAWFAGRVWTFDYPGRRLLWRAAGDLPPHDKKHAVKLSFKTDAGGKRQLNFARLAVEVDGEAIDFLFDTGASDVWPEEVLKAVGDGRPADRATSFLTRSQFEKWRKRHPEWRALDNVKTLSASGGALIEVPRVNIGGFTVGPVWFTVQPDRAFHSYMAQWMDKPTEGAIGGSALRYLRVTVDWPGAVAIFERP